MKKYSGPIFVVTLPLKTEKWMEDYINKSMRLVRLVKNLHVRIYGSAFKRMINDEEYRKSTELYKQAYQEKDKKKSDKMKKQATAIRKELQKKHEWNKVKLRSLVNKAYVPKDFAVVIGSQIIQKIADRVFIAFENRIYRAGGMPKRSRTNDTISNQHNNSNLYIRKNTLFYQKIAIPIAIDPEDQTHVALLSGAFVSYPTIKREPYSNGFKYFVQASVRGVSPIKRTVGSGRVGVDINMQTVAVVSKSQTRIFLLASEHFEFYDKKITRYQRSLSRKRMLANPHAYDENRKVRKGVKQSITTNAMKKLRMKIASLKRRQREAHKNHLNQLVRLVAQMGRIFNIEDIDAAEWSRKFGKSVGKYSPGYFKAQLIRHISQAGGVTNIVPEKTGLTRTCASCGSIRAKTIDQRWHICTCGVTAQRDIQSAFGALCYNKTRAVVNKKFASALWKRNLKTEHDMEIKSLLQTGANKRLPWSIGLESFPGNIFDKSELRSIRISGDTDFDIVKRVRSRIKNFALEEILIDVKN